jgi:hypothetical protein
LLGCNRPRRIGVLKGCKRIINDQDPASSPLDLSPRSRSHRAGQRGGAMKISVLFGLVLEASFLVYCMYMIYLLDVLDPFPREWMIPNILLGAVVLAIGYFIAQRLKRDDAVSQNRLSEHNTLR